MVMEILHEEPGGEGSMQCANHPYKNSAPGGICALCLQEKLGKLVSSSFHAPVFPSPSSSSSPSFRSDFGGAVAGAGVGGLASAKAKPQSEGGECYYPRRAILPFVSSHRKSKKKKKSKDGAVVGNPDPTIVFKRSKSTATPRRGMQFLDDEYSPGYRRGFWSFLYLSKQHSNGKKAVKSLKNSGYHTNVITAVGSSGAGSGSGSGSGSSSGKKREDSVGVMDENNGSPTVEPPIERKVSRSRSVGCGSRSFSGDFFERISTGFGDCTLRRVESQREGKQKVQSVSRNSGGNERVRSCGGIFSGFMIASSSSSSYLVAPSSSMPGGGHGQGHLRSKSWGWAFASPMRAFGKPSVTKRVNSQNNDNNKKNATPNLAAIPSLLAVSG